MAPGLDSTRPVAAPLPLDASRSCSAALQRTALIDRLLRDSAPIQLLVAAPGFGATTTLRQAAERWRATAPARWIECRPAAAVEHLRASLADAGMNHLICVDAPDGLCTEQIKEVAALLLRGARPRLMIASHDVALVDRLPCDCGLFTAEALRFSEAETVALLKDHADIAPELIESAQGWPFALDMMRQAAGKPQASGVGDLATDVPRIAQYFEDVVVPRMSGEALEILAVVAALDSNFSVDLVTWVTQDAQAWHKIEPVIVAELFVSRIRDRSNIYRLHPLFKAFLRAQAMRSAGELRSILLRACEWFRRQGRWDRAIHYAAEAEDSRAIIDIAKQAGGWKMLGGGGLQSVGKALDTLPEQSIEADPLICELRIVSALKAGNEHQMFLTPEDRLVRYLAGFYRDRLQGKRWLQRLYQVRDEVGTADYVTYAVFSSLICLKHLDNGAFDACDAEARRAIHILLEVGHSSGTAYLHSYRARAETMRGNLDSADAHVGRVFAIAWEPLVEVEPLAQLASVHAATIALERGDIAKGRRMMAMGWRFLTSFDGWYDVAAEAISTAVRLALSAGDIGEALRFLEQGDVIASKRSLPRLKVVIAGWRMVTAVASGHVAAIHAARSVLDVMRTNRAGGVDECGHYLAEAIAFAETSHALWRNAPRSALELMRGEAERARLIGALPLQRRALMWAALAAERSGQRATAEELVNRCLGEFANVAMFNVALPVCGDLVPVLRELARKGRLVDGKDAHIVHTLADTAAADLEMEWLSAREEQILELVGAGMTNKEIAGRLAISDSTVKFHRKNIYTKLGVHNRSRALELLKQRRAWSSRNSLPPSM